MKLLPLLLAAHDAGEGQGVELGAAGALKEPDELFKLAVGILLFTEFPVETVAVVVALAAAAAAAPGLVVPAAFALRKSWRSPNLPPVQGPPTERISLSSVRNPLK